MDTIQKILIVGGLGYLGSHTALSLLEHGFSVIIIDNFSNAQKQTQENLQKIGKEKIEFYDIDIREKSDLESFFANCYEQGNSISTVLHFGSKNKQKESCIEPFLYYETNIQGTLNLLKNMEKYHIYNIIYGSSASVYDPEKALPPFSENDKVRSRTPFATTKIIVENILKDMSIHRHFNVFCGRYFNPIGANPKKNLGYEPKGIPTKILPLLIKAAQNEIESFPIYGNNYETKDGTCLMDYIHIYDVAEIHVKMVQYLLEKGKKSEETENRESLFEVINIGTGNGKTIKEMIELVELVSGGKIAYQVYESRTGDTPIVLGNNNKLRNFFQREPQKTIVEAIEDEREYACQKKNF